MSLICTGSGKIFLCFWFDMILRGSCVWMLLPDPMRGGRRRRRHVLVSVPPTPTRRCSPPTIIYCHPPTSACSHYRRLEPLASCVNQIGQIYTFYRFPRHFFWCYGILLPCIKDPYTGCECDHRARQESQCLIRTARSCSQHRHRLPNIVTAAASSTQAIIITSSFPLSPPLLFPFLSFLSTSHFTFPIVYAAPPERGKLIDRTPHNS